MFKHILVGYDGGATARRAFRFAMEMAALGGGKVRVVTVTRVSETGGDTGALLISDTSDDRARDLLEDLKQEAPNQAPFDAALVHGCPGDALLAQVAEHDIDHVVIGHSERGALARWLLGSVSTDLLSRAHVPITVVR
jgi:nucleotide-binding universal stress UspA family protein